MSDPIVQAKGLYKSFTYQKRSKGVRSWLKADYATIEAVKKYENVPEFILGILLLSITPVI